MPFSRASHPARRLQRRSGAVLAAGAMIGLSACSLSDLVSTTLPSNVTDPAMLETPQGAVDRYKGAIMQFRTVVSGANSGSVFIALAGVMSDELTSGEYNTFQSGAYTPLSVVDSRNMTSNVENGTLNTTQAGVWRGLSSARMISQDGRSALTAFAPSAPKDLIGHAHAIQGMSEVMLAELYCSGISLATLVPGGGFEYGPGLTTAQVLERAVAQFDSAIAVTSDSIHFLNFARVGKARALLDLGRYAEAATVVTDVPTNFAYKNYHSTTPAGAIGVANFTSVFGSYGTMSNSEGGTGLNYVTARDPRIIINDTSATTQNWPLTDMIIPRKWSQPNAATAVTIADGIEARLIEAEAALKANNTGLWAQILNALRTTGTYTVVGADTVWALGTGQVSGQTVGIRPLRADSTSTASATLRENVMFRERAFWLYFTGHRLGDMRRLVRQYGRTIESVFPQGAYRVGPDGSYGSDVNLPAPVAELQNNPRYSGCINRDA